MKEFHSEKSSNMKVLIGLSDQLVLTGDQEGEIRLWHFTEDSQNFQFSCLKVFMGHSAAIRGLVLLPNNQFFSASEDGTMRIWEVSSGKSISLTGGRVDPKRYEAATVLPGNLLAVGGYRSDAEVWECFDVWHTQTGQCLFKGQGGLHRPWGMSLATTQQGHLVVHGHCSYKFSIWNVNLETCKQISEIESDRIYSLSVQPSGEIVAAGHSLNVFTTSAKGEAKKAGSLSNSNVVDTIIPLDYYRVLIVDRQGFNSGTIKLVDYKLGTIETLGNSQTSSGDVADSHIAFVRRGLVVSINKKGFCIQRFPKIAQVKQGLAEIRKNARLIAQAQRTGTSFFANVPEELNIQIAAMTGEKSYPLADAEHWAEIYFHRKVHAVEAKRTSPQFFSPLQKYNGGVDCASDHKPQSTSETSRDHTTSLKEVEPGESIASQASSLPLLQDMSSSSPLTLSREDTGLTTSSSTNSSNR